MVTEEFIIVKEEEVREAIKRISKGKALSIDRVQDKMFTEEMQAEAEYEGKRAVSCSKKKIKGVPDMINKSQHISRIKERLIEGMKNYLQSCLRKDKKLAANQGLME